MEGVTPADIRAQKKQQDIVLHMRAVMSTVAGREVIKHLFDSFNVGQLPPEGLSNDFLREVLGHHRAGLSIWQLAAQAEPQMAGVLLAQTLKERRDEEILQDLESRRRNEPG